MSRIALIRNEEHLRASFNVINQLRTHLNIEEYLARIAYQQRQEAYHLVGLWEGEELCSVAGFREMTNLACGKIIYIDDLVTDQAHRGRGHGARLLDWIADFGRQRECSQLHLDSGVQRHDAHRFYLRERMDIVYYHFMKKIKS